MGRELCGTISDSSDGYAGQVTSTAWEEVVYPVSSPYQS